MKDIQIESSSDTGSYDDRVQLTSTTNKNKNHLVSSSSSGMNSASSSSSPWLFLAMAKCPYPFLVTLPFLFFMLIFLGLSRPSIIEEDVANLWIPTRDGSGGTYKKDKEYAKSVGATTQDEMSAFAAMALIRNKDDNLFKEDNLNAIVERMKLIETTPVTYKGMNFTWNDVCLANGLSRETTYHMPCLRLSPIDLFEEARWYFTEEQRSTWYQEVKGKVMIPLVIRYGVLHDKCTTTSTTTTTKADNNNNNNNPSEEDAAACDHAVKLRNDPNYAIEQGYAADHTESPGTGLLRDILSMELNDPCRICIEDSVEERLRQLKDDYVVPAFTTLTQQLRRFLFALEERNDVRETTLKYVESLIKKTASIATKVSREDVQDFYMYYIIRNLYAEGAADFQYLYREVNDPFYRGFICGYDTLICPPEDITLEEARNFLLNHADNMFSSHVTFGAPFPFWSSPDGTGHLFGGNHPVGGSGIDMSAPFDSLARYLDLENKDDQENWRPFFFDNRRRDGFVDPLGNDYLWETMVSTNPVYSWFMAGETEMTAHCGNGDLLGTNTSDLTIDMLTAKLVTEYSQHLCTKYHTPFETDGTRTQQHFARMWFDLLIDSPFVLDIMQGESDPYTWTSGAGCGYDLGYSRFSYTDQPEDVILQNASSELYNIDEGVEIGVVDRTPLIGDVYPPIGQYSFDNPLQHVGLLQTLYGTLVAEDIAKRVRHKNRPGGPLNITEEDAREVLTLFKASFESLWTEGWDDKDDGDVQFVGFFDDAEVPGTLGTFLNRVTLSSGLLTAISILVIAVFSVIFLARRNPVESRAGITLIGVVLVILAFFAAVGLGILVGIKVNLTIAWTLPFIMIGLGVDNVYIILMSLQKQGDYSDKGFFQGMKEVVIPITMTSLVNLAMFGVMNINDIPAVYLSARVACFAVLLLYMGVIFCFPAYCYLDMQRQDAGRRDVFVWKSYEAPPAEEPQSCEKPFLERFLYDWFYQPLIFGDFQIRAITHSLVWAIAALLLALGLYGISIAKVGLGLDDFFPQHHQAHVWAKSQSGILGSWVIHMNWPDIDYSSSDTQMKMIKQFEDAVRTPHVVEIDTRMLWIAEFALWTTRQCDYNMALKPPEERICGRDQYFDEQWTCSGTWKRNLYGLREKYFTDDSSEQCQPYDGGVCRPTSEMHPDDLRDVGVDPENIAADEAKESWCPVFEGWSDEQLTFCLRNWYQHVDGMGGLVLDKDAQCEGEYCEDYMVKVPIPYSAGPTMTTKGVVSHELTLQMMEQTRSVCDQDEALHCWMSGPPFDFWSQYLGIEMNLVEISGASVLIGFGISWVFFACKLFHDRQHPLWKVVCGSLVGACLIAANCFFCLVAVVGISIISGVSLTAFSIMSFVLSVGFAVEYSVHVVSRWLRSDRDSALARVEHTMSFLLLPTFMSFVSSTIGVICLAFTDFEFNTRFFFRPLMIVMFVTYFFGIYWLPVFLTWFEFDFMKLGSKLGPKHKRLQERSGSPLSKIQDFESSQGEVVASSGSQLLKENASSDIETNSSSLPVNMTDCLKTGIGEPNTESFAFLPCYDATDDATDFGDSDSLGVRESKPEDDFAKQQDTFLPCYDATDFGDSGSLGVRESKPEDGFAKQQETEQDKSLLAQLPRPLADCLSGEESKSLNGLSNLEEAEDNSIMSPSSHDSSPSPSASAAALAPGQASANPVKPDPPTNFTVGKNASDNPYTGSSGQSLGTLDIDKSHAPTANIGSSTAPRLMRRPLNIGNIPNALVGQPVQDVAQRLWHESGAIQRPANAPIQDRVSNQRTSNAISPTSASAEASSSDQVTYSTDDAATAGSSINIFKGIDFVPATEAQNAALISPPRIAASMNGLRDRRPGSITTSAQVTSHLPEGPASTGGIIRRTDLGFFGGDGLPPLIRQTQSSSPTKKRFPTSPLRFTKRDLTSHQGHPGSIPYGEQGLLNSRDQYDTRFGGYDFGHVLEGSGSGSAIRSVGPMDPPASNREILRGGSGEVLLVHAVTVFEDDTSNDTVNF